MLMEEERAFWCAAGELQSFQREMSSAVPQLFACRCTLRNCWQWLLHSAGTGLVDKIQLGDMRQM